MEVALLSSFVVDEGDLAAFLVKTYDIVNDPNTNEIVSWSSTNNSFVVWNPTEFARVILPAYFKSNNFSSFTRQLNTYGFRKIHDGQWEYANENFIKDQKHLLKNIQRKDSHHPRDYDELIEKINNHQKRTNLRIERFQQRLDAMETMQKNLMNLFEKAIQNPSFVGQLSDKFASG
ncbi:heat stress transcription factor a-5-like protein [Trifolium pratense]|uniref:Heat stress transcription factor a-5-like protein n=1 Tax=Trifolium pratense TaxID=57577 RepID=A0A2K3PKP7_TRIPR|nr:heat stress transcription factor a-5-like protein [Trifolium pratense]